MYQYKNFYSPKQSVYAETGLHENSSSLQNFSYAA